MADREQIRDLIENWVIWRDAGLWDHFRTVWASEAHINATWYQGSADGFIRASEEGWRRGVSILHFLGGTTITVAGDRATAQTKMTISQRDTVEGVLCDVVCTGRFYDFLERREGNWVMMLRQPLYERDRIDPVRSGEVVKLDPDLLARFPVGYQHLAYLQTRIGYEVKRDMPGIAGPEADDLYARGERWLSATPPTP
jgi:hypothetical protein